MRFETALFNYRNEIFCKSTFTTSCTLVPSLIKHCLLKKISEDFTYGACFITDFRQLVILDHSDSKKFLLRSFHLISLKSLHSHY